MNTFPSVLESITDLTPRHINGLLALATKFKEFAKDWQGLPVPFIRTPVIATSFLEDSTRTKHSFAVAIHKIGATYIDFNAEKSSLKKGEGLEETLLTLQCQGVDLCIIRTSVSNQLSQLKERPPIRIINAGDGTHQHPTQALLDVFTMQEIGMELKGKTIAIVGDCVHSRVTHSLLDLLAHFGTKIILCGPPGFLPKQASVPNVTLCHNADEALAAADLLYLLRIQKERHASDQVGNYQDYHTHFGFNLDRLAKHNKKIPVFHPGPANVGVEISYDLLKSKYYFGYLQVQNSIYMRMAIIQAVLQNTDKNIGISFENRRIEDL